MTDALRKRLNRQAILLDVLASVKEKTARRKLSEAAELRKKAASKRQLASGQVRRPRGALASAPKRQTSRLLLKTQTFQKMLRDQNRKNKDFAEQLGIAPSTWSQVLNRKRAVTPQMKLRLLNHPLVKAHPGGLSKALPGGPLWEHEA